MALCFWRKERREELLFMDTLEIFRVLLGIYEFFGVFQRNLSALEVKALESCFQKEGKVAL